MKLVKCYIEGFGCYSKKEIEFDKNIHQICQNNGTGKSTLAAFIISMFYGLSGSGKKSILENDSKHYKPMNDSPFAGNIEFEYQGKPYRIYRNFSTNETKLTENGVERIVSQSEDLGMKFLKVDRDAFLRTAFINDKFLDGTASNTTIKNSLSQAIEDGDYSVEIKKLEETIKSINSTRIKDSEYSKMKAEIDNCQKEIIKLDSETDDYDTLTKEYNDLDKSIKEDEVQLNEQKDLKATIVKWDTLESKEKELNVIKERIDSINVKYIKGIPSKEDLDSVENSIDRIKEITIKNNALSMSQEKLERYDYLDSKFKDSTPFEAELEQIKEAEAIISNNSISLSIKEEGKQSKEQDDIIKKFNDKPINPDLMDKLQGLCNEILEYRKDLRAQEDVSRKQNSGKKRFGKLNILITAIGVALMIAGIVTLFFNLIPGIVLAIIGVFAAVIGVVIKTSNSGTSSQFNNKKAEEIYKKEEEMKTILAPLGYYASDPINAFNEYHNDAIKYIEYTKGISTINLEIDVLKNKLNDATKIVNDFSLKYGYDSNNIYYTVINDIKEYGELRKEKAQIESNKSENLALIQNAEDCIDKFVNEYALKVDVSATKDWIIAIRNDIINLSTLENSKKSKEEDINEYRENNNLKVKPNISIDYSLQEIVDVKKARYTTLRNKITDLENKKDISSSINSKKEELENQLKERLEQSKMYQIVLNELIEADKELSAKFVEPVKSVFSKYADIIEKNLNEKMEMNKDYSITYEKFGDKKSVEYNSDGEKTIVSLCLRLALIDNLFKDEAPFIVMDDPFNELDPTHMANTKKVLQEIAKEKQIIYMTCDPVRNVK